jgi:DNA-binding PucR family transcriptional regulator
VVLYREVGLIALLSTDPERAAWFGAEELGELTGIGPADVELRRTALCYLDTGSSLIDTAARMHIHRNTVLYRLRRAEALIGRPLTDRQLALHATLRLAEYNIS